MENNKTTLRSTLLKIFGYVIIMSLFESIWADRSGELGRVLVAGLILLVLALDMVREKNIIPCCIFHGVFNALAAFSNEAGQTIGYQVTVCAVLTVISLSYALYLWKKGTQGKSE